jgi:hypothetical protein
MSYILSASPAVRKREENLLIQLRLKQLEAGIDRALEMAKEAGSNAPSQPTAEDAWDLAEVLAQAGTQGLPRGSSVETMAVDTTTPLQRPYGRTYTTVCTSLTIYPLDPMTPAQAIQCGLLNTAGKLSHTTYERMVKEMPGVVAGVLRPWHEAARAGRPHL